MKQLFDELSLQVSKMTTKTYSTSFSLGILLIDRKLRNSIYSIYGFVRVADEIADSFNGYDRELLLKRFKTETYAAIHEGISTNPILNSFQKVVKDYGIEKELIESFFRSMEMDLLKQEYNEDLYSTYILGSAEVVGLMCLRVFTEGKSKLYEELKPSAMKLGAAFQKVNFLRDIKADYLELGRSYFPNVDILRFNSDAKSKIELEIEDDFKVALQGIKKLPKSSRSGVYLAYIYYRSLFKKIRRMPAHRILHERIRINNGHKLGLMLNTMLQNKMNLV